MVCRPPWFLEVLIVVGCGRQSGYEEDWIGFTSVRAVEVEFEVVKGEMHGG